MMGNMEMENISINYYKINILCTLKKKKHININMNSIVHNRSALGDRQDRFTCCHAWKYHIVVAGCLSFLPFVALLYSYTYSYYIKVALRTQGGIYSVRNFITKLDQSRKLRSPINHKKSSFRNSGSIIFWYIISVGRKHCPLQYFILENNRIQRYWLHIVLASLSF